MTARQHSTAGALIWLKVRHLYTLINRIANIAGTDLKDSKWYLAYLVAGSLVWIIASWTMISSAITVWMSQFKPEISLLAETIGALTVAFMILEVARSLRRSPLLLSKADTSFWTGNTTVLHMAYLLQAIKKAAFAFIGSTLILSLFSEGISAIVPEFTWIRFTLFPASVFFLGSLIGSALGFIRLTHNPSNIIWRLLSFFIGIAGVISYGLGLLAIIRQPLPSIDRIVINGITAASMTDMIAAGAITMLLSFLLIAWIYLSKGSMDVRVVVEESSLYAELQAYDLFTSLTASTERRRVTRNYRTAQRIKRAFFPFSSSLPIGQGRAALICHALISSIRQIEYAGDVLTWSSIAVPSGVIVMALPLNKELLLPWLTLCLACASYAREICHVFDSDHKNALINPVSVYGLFTTLIFDSIPYTVLAVFASAGITVPVILSAGGDLAWVLVGILLDLSIVIALGVSYTGSSASRERNSFVISIVALTTVAALVSSAGPWVTVLCLTVLLVVGTALIRSTPNASYRCLH